MTRPEWPGVDTHEFEVLVLTVEVFPLAGTAFSSFTDTKELCDDKLRLEPEQRREFAIAVFDVDASKAIFAPSEVSGTSTVLVRSALVAADSVSTSTEACSLNKERRTKGCRKYICIMAQCFVIFKKISFSSPAPCHDKRS